LNNLNKYSNGTINNNIVIPWLLPNYKPVKLFKNSFNSLKSLTQLSPRERLVLAGRGRVGRLPLRQPRDPEVGETSVIGRIRQWAERLRRQQGSIPQPPVLAGLLPPDW